MWRLLLLIGQTLGFVLVVTAAVAIADPPAKVTDLARTVLFAVVVSGVAHLCALELFFYPEVNRGSAATVGVERCFLCGLACGAAGAAVASFALWVGGLKYGWVGLFGPVLAVAVALAWVKEPADAAGDE